LPISIEKLELFSRQPIGKKSYRYKYFLTVKVSYFGSCANLLHPIELLYLKEIFLNKVKMKSPRIATSIAFILLSMGVVACNQTKSSDTAQTTTADVTTSTKADATKAEREQKREARRKQIEAVLTPEQVKQLQAKMKDGEKLRKALSSLDLTEEQKTKIQKIFEASRPKNPGKSQ
jgi:hypothetical protein